MKTRMTGTAGDTIKVEAQVPPWGDYDLSAEWCRGMGTVSICLEGAFGTAQIFLPREAAVKVGEFLIAPPEDLDDEAAD